jgi:hypothetical protein
VGGQGRSPSVGPAPSVDALATSLEHLRVPLSDFVHQPAALMCPMSGLPSRLRLRSLNLITLTYAQLAIGDDHRPNRTTRKTFNLQHRFGRFRHQTIKGGHSPGNKTRRWRPWVEAGAGLGCVVRVWDLGYKTGVVAETITQQLIILVPTLGRLPWYFRCVTRK